MNCLRAETPSVCLWNVYPVKAVPQVDNCWYHHKNITWKNDKDLESPGSGREECGSALEVI